MVIQPALLMSMPNQLEPAAMYLHWLDHKSLRAMLLLWIIPMALEREIKDEQLPTANVAQGCTG
eukprot:1097471-Rhodomonas_salina.1